MDNIAQKPGFHVVSHPGSGYGSPAFSEHILFQYVHADFTRSCLLSMQHKSQMGIWPDSLLPMWKSVPRDCMLYYWLYLRHSATSIMDNIAQKPVSVYSLTAMLSTGRESHEAIPIIVLCLTHQEWHQEFRAKKCHKFLGVLICLVTNRGTWLPFLADYGSPAFSEHVHADFTRCSASEYASTKAIRSHPPKIATTIRQQWRKWSGEKYLPVLGTSSMRGALSRVNNIARKLVSWARVSRGEERSNSH